MASKVFPVFVVKRKKFPQMPFSLWLDSVGSKLPAGVELQDAVLAARNGRATLMVWHGNGFTPAEVASNLVNRLNCKRSENAR